MRPLPIAVLCSSMLLLSQAAAAPTDAELKQQVADSERAFAATMKARDHAAMGRFVADEAVFFSEQGPLHGREAILKAWSKYYEGREAPFSWAPEQVEVLPSGKLAYSGGPVYDPGGRQVGRFNSIWRLEAPGQWKVVFDRGEPLPCKCKP